MARNQQEAGVPDDKTYHHGNLANALLEAAEQLLLEEGVAGVGLRAVAKLAGVSHAAPYRHFADKHALLEALAGVGFARLRDAMHESINAAPEDPRQQLIIAGEAYVALALANPAMNDLMFGGTLAGKPKSPALIEVSEQAFGGLLAIIENGRRAGIYIDQDPLALAAATWSLVHGLAMLFSTGRLTRSDAPTQDSGELAQMMVEFLLNGIAAADRDSGGRTAPTA